MKEKPRFFFYFRTKNNFGKGKITQYSAKNQI